ncbi:MAG: hypothetical protein NTZ17_00835 [Phycisphaerae bacterium]|nr:hypothetical protein [Phycisphaerae bacterium]
MECKEKNEYRRTCHARYKADRQEVAAVIRTVGQYWNLSKLPRQA